MMNQPLRKIWTIKETLDSFNGLNQLNLLKCQEACPYNKWLVHTKINSKIFINNLTEKEKYIRFHNIIKKLSDLDIKKELAVGNKYEKIYNDAISMFIIQGCSFDFFGAVLEHFCEKQVDFYIFLDPFLLLELSLTQQKPQKALFLSQYILAKQLPVNLQQINHMIYMALKYSYYELVNVLFKVSNKAINSTDYNDRFTTKPCDRLQILCNFINTNLTNKDLLIEIIVSIFLQNSYLIDADSVPKLIFFLAEYHINLLNHCYDILFRLKNNQYRANEDYVLSQPSIQHKITQISRDCNISKIQIELLKLQEEYPFFFIPVIEKKYYESKLNINLQNIEQDAKISYIKCIITQAKQLIKFKTM